MKKIITKLGYVLGSELLKHRSTFVFWATLLSPLVVAGITFLLVMADRNYHADVPARWHVLFNYKAYFHIFTLILILWVSQMNYLEHKNNTWKNIYVLPVPPWIIFFSKLLFAYLILAFNILLFYLLVLTSEVLLGLLRPELGFQHGNYWLEALIPTIKYLLASSTVIALMFFISHYFKSLIVSITLGLAGYVSAFVLFLLTSRAGYTGFPYAKLHPFNFSGHAFRSFGTGNHSLNMESVYYGVLGAIVILIGYYFVSRQRNIV